MLWGGGRFGSRWLQCEWVVGFGVWAWFEGYCFGGWSLELVLGLGGGGFGSWWLWGGHWVGLQIWFVRNWFGGWPLEFVLV